jgi:hypothetical protein
MAEERVPARPPRAGDTRLAVLLAMAMFVLVVDTSLMNVSIASVVRPRHDSERRASASRSGVGVGRVHPHREQGRRLIGQARVRARPAGYARRAP